VAIKSIFMALLSTKALKEIVLIFGLSLRGTVHKGAEKKPPRRVIDKKPAHGGLMGNNIYCTD